MNKGGVPTVEEGGRGQKLLELMCNVMINHELLSTFIEDDRTDGQLLNDW